MRKRKIESAVNFLLGMLLILVVIPVFISTFLGRLEAEDLLFNQPLDENSEVELKLPLIVAKQISIQMPQEAIKAQSVIARTQLLAAIEKGEKEPSGFSINDLQTLWGEQFEEYYAKLEKLTKETAGEVLRFDGAYIYAAYHQASAGETRTMSEYYEKSAMPYLSSAVCHEDTTAPEYLKVFFWTKEEFGTLCNQVFSENVNSGEDIRVIKRDSAGYALEVQVGQTMYEGEEFRKKLNLPSACFEITLVDEDVRIVTMGQGHGFGLSQHMAGVLAKEGKNYREILQYFYKEAAIIE
ncbi:MAG: SpoIID/LytB domain-containing protein [Roseburia sp.]|nr:SpoIID/LytB domain-containing protein [Roseburia sp.]